MLPCPNANPTRSKQVQATPLLTRSSSKRQRPSKVARSPPPSPSPSSESSGCESEAEALEVLTDGDWWEAYCIGKRADGCICVRYVGGSPSEDEWIPRHSARVRQPQDAARLPGGCRSETMLIGIHHLKQGHHTPHTLKIFSCAPTYLQAAPDYHANLKSTDL